MSNKLTPQQKYPKFYAKPHLWIDAIDCIYLGNTPNIPYQFELDLETLNVLLIDNELQHCQPLFKPQEGEAFIKDLESAVSVGLNKKENEGVAYYSGDSTQNAWALSLINDSDQKTVSVYIDKTNLSRVVCSQWDGDANVFYTAAYVDKLRELGYYL